MLTLGLLLRMDSEADRPLWRVVALNPEQDKAWAIPIEGPNWFTEFKCSKLESDIEQGRISAVSEDPYAELRSIYYEDLSDAEKSYFDEVVPNIVNPTVELGDGILDEKQRNELIRQIHKNSKSCPNRIRKVIRRYFQRGMVPNAVIANFRRCGAPGESRVPENANGKKVGRPRDSEKDIAAEERSGIKFTQEKRDALEKSIDKEGKNNTRGRYSRIAQDLWETTFSQGTEPNFYDPSVEAPVIKPIYERPEYHTIYYHIKKFTHPRRLGELKYGRHDWELNHRALVGNSQDIGLFPYHIGLYDETKPDIDIVHPLNSNIVIGSPHAGYIRELFSTAIVGMVITIEQGADVRGCLALQNAFSEKVSYYAKYGLTIVEEDFPFHHIFNVLFVDGGVFTGTRLNQFQNSFAMRLTTAGAYQAEKKGPIEQYMGVLKHRVIEGLDGYGESPRERGQPNRGYKAIYTLDDLAEMVLAQVLENNCCHPVIGHPLFTRFDADGVAPYPKDILEWGMSVYGRPKREEPSVIYRNLLVSDIAKVSRKGIRFEGLTYACKEGYADGWFERAGLEGHEQAIDILYDPSSTQFIYLNNKSATQCWLIDNEDNNEHRYSSFYEVRAVQKYQREAEKRAKEQIPQSVARLNAQKAKIRQRAQARHKEQKDDRSKSARVKNKRENMASARKAQRELDSIASTQEEAPIDTVNDNQPPVAPEPPAYNPASILNEVLQRKLNSLRDD